MIFPRDDFFKIVDSEKLKEGFKQSINQATAKQSYTATDNLFPTLLMHKIVFRLSPAETTCCISCISQFVQMTFSVASKMYHDPGTH